MTLNPAATESELRARILDRATSSSRARVARLHCEAIGYDPFDDDPSRSVDDVLETLREYRDEVARARSHA